MLLIALDIATTKLSVITPSNTLAEALEAMTRRGVSQLPVVDSLELMHPMGTLTESAVTGAYNQAVMRRELGEDERGETEEDQEIV